MSTPTRKLSAPKRTPPAPSRRTTAAPSRPVPAPSPARRAARPAVRLSKQPPTAVPAAGREPGPGEPAAIPEKRAADDPRFKRVVDKLNRNAAALRKHPPAAQKAAEAQAASRPQPKERLAKAQEQKVDELHAAEGRKPEAESFLTLLRAEIDKAMPKTLGDTDDFMDEDQRRDLKGGVVGNIDQQKEAATGPVKETAKAPPDTSAVAERASKDLPADTLPQAPVAPLNPAAGMPAPKTDDEVSLQQSKADADRQLEENELTPTQLTKANDARFSDVLKAKGAVETHADAAPQKYRTSEQATLAQAGARALSDERKQGGQMKDVQAGAGRNVKSRQQAAKERDEARRREVTENIERMFTQTKEKVEGKLATLETEVSSMFDSGLEDSIKRMTDYINLRKDAWKADRYGGLGGGALWLKDKLVGLPDEVQVFYDDGLKLFTKDLDALVVRIAAHVERRLREAKDEVANGQKRIADYVEGLDKDLIAVGRAAAEEVSTRFDELRQGIDDKKNDLARNLAQRYKDARGKADDAVKQMREADKGLLVKLAEKVGEVVRILREFKTKIMGMLRKGKDTIALIVADPIGFLSNLLKALGKGFGQFVDRIEDHLKEGFAAWLFGSLAGAGVEIPKGFSLPALFRFVLQVLGFTAAAVRSRVVRVVGERNVALVEKAWDVVRTLIDSGPGALWDMAKEYLADLKEKIIDAAREWLIGAVIKAATTRLLMLFNPVGAIIQAIMMIYNTVMFFIERINQILALVEAVIESVASIALGRIGDAADWIEKSLARAVPVIIAFLARLLGLSGLAERVKDFITRLQTRVANAVDKVIAKIVNGVGKLFGAGRDTKGVPAKEMAARGKDGDRPEEARKQAALGEIRKAMGKGIRRSRLVSVLADVRRRYQLKRAEMVGQASVVVENSDPVTVEGDLSFSPEEINEQSQMFTGLPGGAGGGDIHVGEFRAESTPNLATVRGALAEHMDGNPAWPDPHSRLPARANRPQRATAKLLGRLNIPMRRVPRDSEMTRIVGHLGDFERSFLQDNWSTGSYFQGGHLIGHQFGGPETFDNLVPMIRPLNLSLFADVETFINNALPPVQMGEDTRERPTALEMDFRMTYGAVPATTVSRLVNIIGSRFGSDLAARQRFDDAVKRGSFRLPVNFPARIPTQILLSVTLTGGKPDRRNVAPRGDTGSTSPTGVGGLTATRSDPFITPRLEGPKPAGKLPREPEGGQPRRAPWQATWTFTQSNRL